MVVRFHVVAPVAKKRTFSVRLPILLGRSEEAKFRIQHDLVSRRHCELFERNGQVYVRDLGSTNGTYLNDEQVPVSTKTVVPPGGVVRVGGLSFAVEYQVPAAAAATVAVHDDDSLDGAGGEESRVEGNHAPLTDEQPDFQVVHEDEESPAAVPVVAVQAQVVVCEAAAADAALADTDDVCVPEVADKPVSEPVSEPVPEPAPAPKQPDGFDFLAESVATASPEDASQWPAADNAAADVSDDDQLNSFFKGLK